MSNLQTAFYSLCLTIAKERLSSPEKAVPFKGQNKEKVLCFLEQAQQPLPAPVIAAKLGLDKGTVIAALSDLHAINVVTKRRKQRYMGRVGAPPMLYSVVL